MGYEVKMIVGTTPLSPDSHPDQPSKGLFWIREIAELELCNIGDGPLYKLIQKYKAMKQHPCYFYGSDGNTQVSTDRYDEALYKIPAKEVLKALRKDDLEYRRIPIAIDLLKAIIKEFPKEDPIVVFYR